MRKRTIYALSIALILLLAFNLLLRGGLFSKSLKAVFINKIEENTHASVSVETVRLNLFPPSVIAENVDIRNTPQEKVPLLTAGKIQISFSLWSLLTEVLIIHKIQIQDASILVVQRETGQSNLEFLSGLKGPPSGGKPALVLQRFILQNGTLDWKDLPTGRSFKAKQVDLRVDADPRMENFQIKGQGKELILSRRESRPISLSTLELKLSLTPQSLEIRSLSASMQENSLSAKGTIQFPFKNEKHQGLAVYPLQIETGFKIDLRPFMKQADYLTGHAQWTGSVSGEGRAEGTLMSAGIRIEKKKQISLVENFRAHLILSRDSALLDQISADLFDGKIQGELSADFRDATREIAARINLSGLSLAEPVRIAFPQHASLVNGKTVSISGEAKFSGQAFALQQFRIHLLLTGKQPGALSSKDPFWENEIRLLTFFEGDIESGSGAIRFTNVSANAGNSTLTGDWSLGNHGEIESGFKIRIGNAGEITTLLGYPQWAGEIDLDGEAGGRMNDPVIKAAGKVKGGRYMEHPLGDGSTKLSYKNKELVFSDISIRHNSGAYTGEGSLTWDQPGKTGYHFETRARNGYPNDIIRLFYDDLPLDARADGSVTITGSDKEFRVDGSAEVYDGSLFDMAFDRGNVRFNIDSGKVRFPKIILEKGLSSVNGEGEIRYDGGYEASIVTKNFRLEDISFVRNLNGLQGLFSGEIEGKGTFQNPHLILTGNFPLLSYRSQTVVEGEARIILDDKSAEIHAGFNNESVRLDGSVSITPPYRSSLTFSGKEMPLSPLLAASSSWQFTPFSGSVTGTVSLEGPLSQPSDLAISAKISRLSANLNGYDLTNKDNLAFRIHNRELTIDSFRLFGEGTSLNLAGGLVFFKQYGLFISGEADLGLLKSFQKIVTQGIGKAYLVVKISDEWDNPKIQGGLTVQEGQIRTSFLRDTVQISNLGLFFNEHQVLLENLDGAMGEGSFHGSGKLDLEGLKPGAFGFMLETPGIRISPLSGWASTVAGTLFLKGNPADQELQGEVVLSHGEYKTPFDLKALISALARSRNRVEPIPYFGPIRLNVRLTGDDKLDINNNIARLPFTVDLTLRGTVDHPALIGRMEAVTGSIQFSNSTFNLVSGTVDFTNPEFIEPIIDVKAQTSVTSGNRNYQIVLELSGTPDKLEPTFTADDPSLTRPEILALLLSGKGSSGTTLLPQTSALTTPQTSAGLPTLPVPISIGTQLELPGSGQVSFEPAAPTIRASGAAPRVSVEQRMLGDRFTLSYAYTINPEQDQLIKMEYMLNRNMSIQGIRDEYGYINSNLKFRFEFK